MSYFEQRIQEIRNSELPKRLFRNVVTETSRHGKTNYYYRVGNGPRTRLPDRKRVGEEAFARAYDEAVKGLPPAEKKRRSIVPKEFGEIGVSGYVYFAKAGAEVKIGFTTNIKARVKSIQTHCAKPVEVVAVIPGSRGTEQFFHDRFSDHRIGGEWFSLVGLLAEFLNVRETTPND